MKKSYRRAARRRHVSVKLPEPLVALLLVDAGYMMGRPVLPSERRKLIEMAALSHIATLIDATADDSEVCLGEDDEATNSWLNWYAGLSSLDAPRLRAFAERTRAEYDHLTQRNRNVTK